MNAVILAAGTSSRFVPLSYERPKSLLEVRGEILIERQIRQLKESAIDDITMVTGYKTEMFTYLKKKYGVELVYNKDYYRYNNISSIIRVIDKLADTFVCCSDLYFRENVFAEFPQESYYASRYASSDTEEYCLSLDEHDYIKAVTIGGRDSWYMIGHAFFSKTFSERFCQLLIDEYRKEEVRNGYWEDVYIRHINELPMKVKRYSDDDIFEFDTLDELRSFDLSYMNDTRSSILKRICVERRWKESELCGFKIVSFSNDLMVFQFQRHSDTYQIEWGIDCSNIVKI